MERRFDTIDAQFDEMHRRFDELLASQDRWARIILYANVCAVVAAGSLEFAAGRL